MGIVTRIIINLPIIYKNQTENEIRRGKAWKRQPTNSRQVYVHTHTHTHLRGGEGRGYGHLRCIPLQQIFITLPFRVETFHLVSQTKQSVLNKCILTCQNQYIAFSLQYLCIFFFVKHFVEPDLKNLPSATRLITFIHSHNYSWNWERKLCLVEFVTL